ncbi:MAG: site-2 protease family protein [Thermoplasmata archaeon]
MTEMSLQEIESEVRKYFYVYETKLMPELIEFKVVLPDDKKLVEKNFRSLWLSLKKNGYLPSLGSTKSEYTIQVIRIPPQRFRSIYVNIAFLIATLISTILAGSVDYAGYFNLNWLSLDSILGGAVFFAFPLLAILGLHELGHYFAAKKNGVKASLPFFIPAPTIIGTLGAFISLREPIPDRKALLEIGASGPIVGFLVAIPVAIIGNYLGSIMHPVIVDSLTVTMIYPPFIYYLINFFIPTSGYMFPTAFAAWVGFVVTAINLLPIGQLDGGHIARALLGTKSKYLSWAFIAFLFAIGLLYLGWLIFAIFVLFLGLSHPPSLNDISRVSKKGYFVGIVAILLIALTFVPVPLSQTTLTENFSVSGHYNNTLIINDLNYSSGLLEIKNTGDKMINITTSTTASDGIVMHVPSLIGNISINETRYIPFNFTVTKGTVPGLATASIKMKTELSKTTRFFNMSFEVFNSTKVLVWDYSNIIINSPYLNVTLQYLGNVTQNVKIMIPENTTIMFNGTIVMNGSLSNGMILMRPDEIVSLEFYFKNTGNYDIIAYYEENATLLRVNYV